MRRNTLPGVAPNAIVSARREFRTITQPRLLQVSMAKNQGEHDETAVLWCLRDTSQAAGATWKVIRFLGIKAQSHWFQIGTQLSLWMEVHRTTPEESKA